ncbi:MAG: hypothetical protein ACRDT8_09215 [Micromonosporaceae bacterium]
MRDDLTPDLSRRLTDLTDDLRPAGDPLPDVLAGVNRVRRRRFLLGGAALAATAAAGLAGGWRALTFPEIPAAAPDGPFLGWKPVNPVNSTAVETAKKAWDDATGHPHTDHRVYAAVTGTILGSVVILAGRDHQGQPRLAMLTGTPGDPDQGKVWLRADRPAPDPVTTRALTLVTSRVGPGVGEVAGAQPVLPAQPVTPTPGNSSASAPSGRTVQSVFVIALAAPGVEHIRRDSTVADQHWGMDTPGGPKSRLMVESTFPDAAAYNTTFTGYIEGVEMFTAPGRRGIGDPVPVTGAVTQRKNHHVTVQVPSRDAAKIEPGLLAVTPDGLIGKVVDTSGRGVRVQRVTAPGFTMEAHSAISDHPGMVAGTGDGVVFTRDDGRTTDVNRVVVNDPAQLDAPTGGVTVGFVTGHRASRMRLRLAAGAGDVVEILVPAHRKG